jgi:hypothetical protein
MPTNADKNEDFYLGLIGVDLPSSAATLWGLLGRPVSSGQQRSVEERTVALRKRRGLKKIE